MTKSIFKSGEIEDILNKFNVKGIRKSGDNDLVAFCPFHDNKNTPSFSINIHDGRWICFSGKCGLSGDYFSLISKLSNTPIAEVKKQYEINYGDVEYQNKLQEAMRIFNEVKNPQEFNEVDINNFDINQLTIKPIEEVGGYKDYLKSINISIDMAKKIGMGYCFSFPYKNRIVIPIYTDKNVTYEFRDTTGKSSKKCLYLEGTKKLNFLFSIKVNNDDSCFLTEGTKDAMTIADFGFNSACTFGCDISEKQVAELLKRGFNNIFIMRDNDDAGFKSSKSTFEYLHNFINCSIIKYPSGYIYKDPNEIPSREEFIRLLQWNQHI